MAKKKAKAKKSGRPRSSLQTKDSDNGIGYVRSGISSEENDGFAFVGASPRPFDIEFHHLIAFT